MANSQKNVFCATTGDHEYESLKSFDRGFLGAGWFHRHGFMSAILGCVVSFDTTEMAGEVCTHTHGIKEGWKRGRMVESACVNGNRGNFEGETGCMAVRAFVGVARA